MVGRGICCEDEPQAVRFPFTDEPMQGAPGYLVCQQFTGWVCIAHRTGPATGRQLTLSGQIVEYMATVRRPPRRPQTHSTTENETQIHRHGL